MTVVPQCLGCRHFRPDPDASRPLTCAAFPAPRRIPGAILLGEHDHREPFPGDGGIRFEAGEPRDTDTEPLES